MTKPTRRRRAQHEILTVALPPELAALIRRNAAADDRTISHYLRRVLSNALASEPTARTRVDGATVR
jgi:hypothetical protein